MAPRKSRTEAAAPKKPLARRRKKVTHEMIQERAYHISLSGTGGSPEEHWFLAERELQGV